MSLALEPLGTWKSFGAALGTTSAITVYTADPNGRGALGDFINLANVDGTSPVDVTVEVYDLSATASYALLSTYSLAADSYHQVDLPLFLEPGDEIRVTAGAANDLVVVGRVKEFR